MSHLKASILTPLKPTGSMSDPKPDIPKPEGAPSPEIKPETAKDAVKDAVKKPKTKGFTNPALRMMGIPPLRLPSRNWMIFWTVLSVGVGGVAYDKYQQKQIRKKWMERVAKYGEQKLGPNQLARKVTVYVAPPPSDYLDQSMYVFRRYMKPILNSAGVDFQVQSEDRQGVIRSVVSAEIRALRREILDNEAKLKQLEQDKKWYNRVKNWWNGSSKKDREAEEQALLNKKFTDDLNFADVLGVYYKNTHKDEKVISEDAEITEPSMQGGVICIGRGAYKEYLHGLHEGLLGPLTKPIDHIDGEEDQPQVETEEVENIEPPKVQSIDTETTLEVVSSEVVTPVADELKSIVKEPQEEGKLEVISETKSSPDETKSLESELSEAKSSMEDDEEENNEEKKRPIPKPFISPDDYSTAKFAPEFEFPGRIPTQSQVSPFFQQPILVIPVYHLIGFLQIPQRIYRYYTQRELSEKYGKATVALVENLQSPFTLDDVDLGKDEELDWPKKWVKAGLERKSEWTSPLITDERVLSKLKIYDPERLVVGTSQTKEE